MGTFIAVGVTLAAARKVVQACGSLRGNKRELMQVSELVQCLEAQLRPYEGPERQAHLSGAFQVREQGGAGRHGLANSTRSAMHLLP